MRRCTYCGNQYDDTVTVCVIDRQPLVQVHPLPEDSSKQSYPSVEFLRLLFKSPEEEEFAVECAQFLANVVGDRVLDLRPDTKWSEILQWFGPKPDHAALKNLSAAASRRALFAMLLKKRFGPDANEIMAASEFMTFREFVEYACRQKRNAA